MALVEEKKRTDFKGKSNPMYKHGAVGTRLYSIYTGMLKRCRQPTTRGYERYGGRGIKVCDDWKGKHGFEHFRDWANGNGYREDLTLDRIDVNGNYEPGNCKWSTHREQANNKRNNVRLEYNGECHTLAEWARLLGKNPITISDRHRKGWSAHDVLFFHQDKPVGNPSPWTEETRRKQYEIKKKDMKPIIQMDKDGNVLARFESVHEAERNTGVARSTITGVATGRTKKPKHYLWKYGEKHG